MLLQFSALKLLGNVKELRLQPKRVEQKVDSLRTRVQVALENLIPEQRVYFVFMSSKVEASEQVYTGKIAVRLLLL